ncbi:hypothetical protein GW17_00039475, partial [Ensete ventricosum]
VFLNRWSLCSVTRICSRMISAEVIGLFSFPGELSPRVIPVLIGDDRLAFSPSAFLIRLFGTDIPGPHFGDPSPPQPLTPSKAAAAHGDDDDGR